MRVSGKSVREILLPLSLELTELEERRNEAHRQVPHVTLKNWASTKLQELMGKMQWREEGRRDGGNVSSQASPLSHTPLQVPTIISL